MLNRTKLLVLLSLLNTFVFLYVGQNYLIRFKMQPKAGILELRPNTIATVPELRLDSATTNSPTLYKKTTTSMISTHTLYKNTTTSVPKLKLNTTTSTQKLKQNATVSIPKLKLNTRTSTPKLYENITTSIPKLRLNTTTNTQKLKQNATVGIPKLKVNTTISILKLYQNTTTSIPKLRLNTTTNTQKLKQNATVGIPKLKANTTISILKLYQNTTTSIPKLRLNTVTSIPKLELKPVTSTPKLNTTQICPEVTKYLVGLQNVSKLLSSISMEKHIPYDVQNGGLSFPHVCKARQKVAIIVPYRNRPAQLDIFLRFMHNFLRRQLLEYRIIIVDQVDDTPFNRGMLLNIGAIEAAKLYKFDCLIFHDVDLLPENDYNSYTCVNNAALHLSVLVNKHGYRLLYDNIFGGVMAIQPENFVKINGFSNLFFGWGGEDDDMYKRIKVSKLKAGHAHRWNRGIPRYTMLGHSRSKIRNMARWKLLKNSKVRHHCDGLNSLTYRLNKVELKPLYTSVSISMDLDFLNSTLFTKCNMTTFYEEIKFVEEIKRLQRLGNPSGNDTLDKNI
ncbi:unnamed protein product [Owenia fusiformis]|uniref:Beta-1,4-N-acetylgalactosaminyltransferase bre-4 n=1 Tax=Owenia fusiformis TaxID=6347 RepID=A0A8S4N4G1_OWEFU|nr:unnamed protein product [Owenia fusiformis]